MALSVPYYLQRNVYSTGIGEQRSLRLEDGSTVEINARSRIRVRYSAHERHIDLLEGQALFNVAKNRARSFIVQSGPTQIRAVGTQFDVYRKRNGTVVTVVEGRVSILTGHAIPQPGKPGSASGSAETRTKTGPNSQQHAADSMARERKLDSGVRASDASSGGILLAAGQQLTVSSTALAQPQSADIAAATAWTQRRLIFTRAPLSEVVEEFNRYNTTQLVITDPSIAATEVSGSFSSSDPSALLHFLREVGTYTIRETGSITEISRR